MKDGQSSGIVILRTQTDVSALAGGLFEETFGDPPPADGVHYLAVEPSGNQAFTVAGYYHVTHRDEYALVGGLCVAAAYRRRGIAELLEREAMKFPEAACAFFAYVGNPARALRVGFQPTAHQHLYVQWVGEVTEESRARIVARAHAEGPF